VTSAWLRVLYRLRTLMPAARHGERRLCHERALGEPGPLGGSPYLTELLLAEIEPDRSGPLHPLASPPPSWCPAVLHGVRGFRPVPPGAARLRDMPFPRGGRSLLSISVAFVPHNHHARLDRARSSLK
jgi:hypothetical protein